MDTGTAEPLQVSGSMLPISKKLQIKGLHVLVSGASEVWGALL